MGDEDVTEDQAVRATWAHIEPAVDSAVDLTRFSAKRHLSEVFIAVPWSGVEVGTARAVIDLRSEGISVAALGTDARWALDPRPYMQWIRRVRTSTGAGQAAGVVGGHDTDPTQVDPSDVIFTGIHLDVEPWRLPIWDIDRARATRGLIALIHHAHTLVPDLPLSADLPHWLCAEPYWETPESNDIAGNALWYPIDDVDSTQDEGHFESDQPVASAPSDQSPASPSSNFEPPPERDSPSQERPRIRASMRAAIRPTPGALAPPPTLALPTEPGLPVTRMREPAHVAAARRSRRSVFEAALEALDSVTILVPRTRAHGQGGILEVSARARAACAAAGVAYLIGVETRPTTDPRKPRATFHDSGAIALTMEAERVHAALSSDSLFRGIAVHDWNAWRDLPSTV